MTEVKYKRFRSEAKSMVDVMFNSKLFKDDLTRDEMNSIEDFIQFSMESGFDSHLKIEKLNEKINKRRGV
jgi:hypothetical protein